MKLYTQNVCPKCMLVKFVIDQAGKTDEVEFINLDEHEEYREYLKSKNFSTLPVLEVDGKFFTDQKDIAEIMHR